MAVDFLACAIPAFFEMQINDTLDTPLRFLFETALSLAARGDQRVLEASRADKRPRPEWIVGVLRAALSSSSSREEILDEFFLEFRFQLEEMGEEGRKKFFSLLPPETDRERVAELLSGGISG